MPLCNKCRGREKTCLQEHRESDDPVIGCGLRPRKGDKFVLPTEYKKYDVCTPAATPSPPSRGGQKRSRNVYESEDVESRRETRSQSQPRRSIRSK